MGKLANIAYDYCLKNDINLIYGGMYGHVAEIYSIYGGKAHHPLNRSAAVMGQIAKSKKFKYGGFIKHLRTKYNCYEPVKPSKGDSHAK